MEMKKGKRRPKKSKEWKRKIQLSLSRSSTTRRIFRPRRRRRKKSRRVSASSSARDEPHSLKRRPTP